VQEKVRVGKCPWRQSGRKKCNYRGRICETGRF